MSARLTSDQLAARDRLRELVPPGSTISTVLLSVSSSGMSRRIMPVVTVDGQPFDLSGLVARAGIAKRARSGDGLTVGGAGMDMGFHLVYSISRALYPDGHRCTGEREHRTKRDGTRVHPCPSNDHANDWGRLAREYAERHEDDATLADTDHDAAVAYCSARAEYIRERMPATYSRRRMHSDGGYAVSQRWI